MDLFLTDQSVFLIDPLVTFAERIGQYSLKLLFFLTFPQIKHPFFSSTHFVDFWYFDNLVLDKFLCIYSVGSVFGHCKTSGFKPKHLTLDPNHRPSADPFAIGWWFGLYPADGSASADGQKIHHRLNTGDWVRYTTESLSWCPSWDLHFQYT